MKEKWRARKKIYMSIFLFVSISAFFLRCKLFFKREKLPEVPEDKTFLGKVSSTNRSQDAGILVYNRVPKCGSSTIVQIMKTLGKNKKFAVKSSRNYREHFLSDSKQRELLSFLKKEKKPFFYDRHFYFFNMTSLGEKVNLINMVRNPMERIVSNFYFVRNPSRWRGRETAPKQSWFTKSFSDCVKNNDTECLVAKGERSQEFQMRYFCECERPGMTEREMMLEAMETLEKEYSVVGVMERFNDSLLVMEKYLPGWFSGSLSALSRVSPSLTNRNPHPTFSHLSPKTQETLISRLGYDIEFYHFVIQRLEAQLRKINE